MVSVQSHLSPDVNELRSNATKRSDYIEVQLYKSRQWIRSYISRGVYSHQVNEATKDACTEFCIGAWRGILTFNGRGDLGAYVTYRGRLYVYEFLRNFRGRVHPKPDFAASSLDQRLFAEPWLFLDAGPSVEDIVISNEAVSAYLKNLAPREREVVHLVLDGSSDGKVLRCGCKGRHSLTRDLCDTLGLKVSTVEKILIGLRKTIRSMLPHE